MADVLSVFKRGRVDPKFWKIRKNQKIDLQNTFALREKMKLQAIHQSTNTRN